uniref:Uncharacterized protein n=1 Tax=Salix viminalis TaxID=40686 RepID=A0A6N2MBK5_SALVM
MASIEHHRTQELHQSLIFSSRFASEGLAGFSIPARIHGENEQNVVSDRRPPSSSPNSQMEPTRVIDYQTDEKERSSNDTLAYEKKTSDLNILDYTVTVSAMAANPQYYNLLSYPKHNAWNATVHS